MIRIPKQVSSDERGFTLFYALLVISVVLAITASIFSIILKEVQLASFGKASQIAFYAAETGAECAIYWSAIRGFNFDGTETISCGTDSGGSSETISNVTSPFTVNVGTDGACAEVSIGSSGGGTTVLSRGYNICPTLGANPRRVERGLELTF